MAKYLDPKANLTFRKIFGEHKHLVISLLNALLPLKDDERVESIEYLPAEKIPDRNEAEKYSIVDVCCRDNQKREFLVAIQMKWTESFMKRVLRDASKACVAQTKKGMDYPSLLTVYVLNFVNATFLKDVDDYYHYYHVVYDKCTDKVIDGLHLIFVEWPKFRPITCAERKMQVLWLRFLTEIDEDTREVPAELLENAEVSEALELVEIAAFSDAEMRAYDKFWDMVSCQRTYEAEIEETIRQRVVDEIVAETRKKVEAESKKNAEEKIKKFEAETKKKTEAESKKNAEEKIKKVEAEVEAEVDAKIEAKAKAKIEELRIYIARKMKAINIPVTQIAEITSLTIEQVEAL